jgi:putative thioredoxin
MDHILGKAPAAANGPAAAAQGPAGDLIKDSNTRSFVADVLEASRAVPVLVDFWAPWCGPCKQLTPVLEKVVREARGAVKLVKINIDENQDIARQMRIQSIPAVFAFRNGQPVDGFMGALPESEVRRFIQRLAGDMGPSPIDELMGLAEEAAEQGDLGAAAQAYAQILQEEPQHAGALAGLAKCYLMSGDLARAEQTLALVPPDQANNETVASVRAALTLHAQAEKAGDLGPLRAKAAADPKDFEAQLALAAALPAAGHAEEAIDILLAAIKADRNWNEGAARKQLLTLFEALGSGDPMVAQGRRRLSAILFS